MVTLMASQQSCYLVVTDASRGAVVAYHTSEGFVTLQTGAIACVRLRRTDIEGLTIALRKAEDDLPLLKLNEVKREALIECRTEKGTVAHLAVGAGNRFVFMGVDTPDTRASAWMKRDDSESLWRTLGAFLADPQMVQ